MKPNKTEPEVEPIISDAAARFTMVLFLALFTVGVALFIWRGLSSIPEGDHWIDQVMGAIRAFSTFVSMAARKWATGAAGLCTTRGCWPA